MRTSEGLRAYGAHRGATAKPPLTLSIPPSRGSTSASGRTPTSPLAEPDQIGEKLLGRLKLRVVHRDLQTRSKFEGFQDRMEVLKILRSPYTGRAAMSRRCAMRRR